jgi:hypothetical protein
VLYAGALKAAGPKVFVEAAPGAAFRYRDAALRRMTAEELAATGTHEDGPFTVGGFGACTTP